MPVYIPPSGVINSCIRYAKLLGWASIQFAKPFRTSQPPGKSARLLIGHLWMRIGAGLVGVDPPYCLLLKVQADS
jgi:hypothetical protein